MDGVVDHRLAIAALLEWLVARGDVDRIVAVGHRIVHGGPDRAVPAPVDARLLESLEELVPLAPLHQPHGLLAIRALGELLPGCLQVACFDTAFHHSLPPHARQVSIADLAGGQRLQRVGFHGLSYEHLARELSIHHPGARRAVLAHLGNGASMCALKDGKSVDTTMGLTPLDGLPMGTRSGSVDPGLLLWLLQHGGFDAEALADLLYRRSGLLGLSGLSADMRVLLASADARAREAVDVFTYQCAKALAALTVPLGGLDAIVFTGGIGENAVEIRAEIVRRCAWLGVALDDAANQRNDRCISSPASSASIWIIPANEEIALARHALAVLRAGSRR